MSKIGWGILGPGSIAHRFLKDLPKAEGARLAAVASRTLEKAEEFAEQYGFEKAYGSYEELVADPNVQVVYVSTPHPFHMEHAMLAMEAGKAVLCEKPVAVNASQLKKMIETAKKNNVFFMEAMWTRFFPVSQKVKEVLESGKLGQITLLKASFGFGGWVDGMPQNPEGRLFNPDLAGGSILDVGVYPVSYASFLTGKQPSEIKAISTNVDTGVDGMMACLFHYDNGGIAMLDSAVVQNTNHDAVIHCEHGTIVVDGFWHPGKATVTFNDPEQENLVFTDDFYETDGKEGFIYEQQAVMDYVRAGKTESPIMPWAESLAIMNTLDEIRQQVGVIFPFEQE